MPDPEWFNPNKIPTPAFEVDQASEADAAVSPFENPEPSIAADPGVPVGTNEGLPDHEDSKEEADAIAPLRAIVIDKSTLKDGDFGAVIEWNERKNEFVKSLVASGAATIEELDGIRMYHVLNGSSPIGGKVVSFDLPGDVFQKYIRSHAGENPLAQE